MFVNFSSSALSTHTVEGFENNRNICEELMCLYIYIYIYISPLSAFTGVIHANKK